MMDPESGGYLQLNSVDTANLSADERYFLLWSLFPLNALAVAQYVFAIFCNEKVEATNWIVLYSIFGMQCIHVIITWKTFFDFYKAERPSSTFRDFIEGSYNFFSIFHLLLNLTLLALLAIVYIDPLFIAIATNYSDLSVTEKRSLVGLCIVAVLIEAVRTLLTILISKNDTTYSRVLKLLLHFDPMLRNTGMALNGVHSFLLWILCGLSVRLELVNTWWEQNLLFGAVALHTVRYLLSGETTVSKCVFVVFYALYLFRLVCGAFYLYCIQYAA